MTDAATTAPGTTEPVIITRDLDLDVSTEHLWNMIADGNRWTEWLTERADVIVQPEQSGIVVDEDGVERRVAIQSVVPGRRVRFAWWPTDRPDESSMVELLVSPSDDGDHSRLSITEVYAATGTSATATVSRARGIAWDVRLMLLVLCLDSVALVRT